jgi:hypothetical protein
VLLPLPLLCQCAAAVVIRAPLLSLSSASSCRCRCRLRAAAVAAFHALLLPLTCMRWQLQAVSYLGCVCKVQDSIWRVCQNILQGQQQTAGTCCKRLLSRMQGTLRAPAAGGKVSCAPRHSAHGTASWLGQRGQKDAVPASRPVKLTLTPASGCVLTCAVLAQTYPALPPSVPVTAPAPGPVTAAAAVPPLLACSHHICSRPIACVLHCQVHKGQVETCRTRQT